MWSLRGVGRKVFPNIYVKCQPCHSIMSKLFTSFSRRRNEGKNQWKFLMELQRKSVHPVPILSSKVYLPSIHWFQIRKQHRRSRFSFTTASNLSDVFFFVNVLCANIFLFGYLPQFCDWDGTLSVCLFLWMCVIKGVGNSRKKGRSCDIVIIHYMFS